MYLCTPAVVHMLILFKPAAYCVILVPTAFYLPTHTNPHAPLFLRLIVGNFVKLTCAFNCNLLLIVDQISSLPIVSHTKLATMVNEHTEYSGEVDVPVEAIQTIDPNFIASESIFNYSVAFHSPSA